MRKLLLLIAGVDEEKLRESTKNERIIYPTLGLLMCFAAMWTGLGMTYKLTQGFELNILISIVVFILIASFALMLEMVVVGTLKYDYKIIGNLGVRVGLGINLMLMQVLPILVIVFQPNINMYKEEESIKKNLEIREKETRVQNIDLLYSEKERIDGRLDTAKNRKENPPINRNIEKEEVILSEKLNNLNAKESELERSQRQLISARSRVSVAERKIIEINASENKDGLSEAQRELRNAQASLGNATRTYESTLDQRNELKTLAEEQSAKVDKLKMEYHARLENEYREALEEKNNQEQKINVAKEKIEETSQKLKNAELANKNNKFFNDLIVLFEMMKKQTSVLLVSLFIVMVALMIDLIPILTKIQIGKGVYAKMISDEEEIKKSVSEMKKKEIITELERKNLEIEKLKLQINNQKNEIKKEELEKDIEIKSLERKANQILNEEKSDNIDEYKEDISMINSEFKKEDITKTKKRVNAINKDFINQIKSSRLDDEEKIMEDIKKEL